MPRASSASAPAARKLSVAQMLRLMQLEVEKAARHRYPLSAILVQADGLDEEAPAVRRGALGEVFRCLKRITFERSVQGLGFWTDRVLLAVFPHVSPDQIAGLGEAVVEGARGVEHGDGHLSVSAGVAHNQHAGPMSFEILLREAETGLSMAARGGGDRCVQWKDVETELDRLRDELEAQMAEVDRRAQEFAAEQDEIAERRGRDLVERIQAAFERETPTAAVVRLEKEMIALALAVIEEWRDTELARELANSRRQVDNLERRVRKLTGLLDVTEAELKRVAAMKEVDTGIASIYRTVQGLSDDDPSAGVKKELMKSIFEANLALLGKSASES